MAHLRQRGFDKNRDAEKHLCNAVLSAKAFTAETRICNVLWKTRQALEAVYVPFPYSAPSPNGVYMLTSISAWGKRSFAASGQNRT